MQHLVEIRTSILKRLLRSRLHTNGHLSGPMGIVDLLTYLYFVFMKIDVNDPRSVTRDRFILSGYHYPALYCTLAERGFFAEEAVIGRDGLRFEPQPNHTTRGFEVSSNSSLGQGISIANGIALALRLRRLYLPKVFVVIGDGEANEGQIWESLLTTAHYNLSNVVLIVNINQLQLDGPTSEIKRFDFVAVLGALGFNVITADGHDFVGLDHAFSSLSGQRPNAIALRTCKGHGVSFIQEAPMRYHACQLSRAEYDKSIAEIECHASCDHHWGQ